MSVLELSNQGRTVKIKIGKIHLQYFGPKNLVRFRKINQVIEGCVYVDTVFRKKFWKYVEEDYIDLNDLLMEYSYDSKKVLRGISRYVIKKPGKKRILGLKK